MSRAQATGRASFGPAAAGAAILALALGALAACQPAGQGAAEPPPEAVALDWTATPWGACVASRPAVAFQPVARCEVPTALPGFPFAAIPYLGTLLSAGTAAAASDYSDCAGGAASALIHNRQAAYLLAQQCMDAADIAAMQRGLRGLGLLAAAEEGRIDARTFAAMRAWHLHVHRGTMDLGPTKEFGARVVESAGIIAGIDRSDGSDGTRAPGGLQAARPPGVPVSNAYGQPNPYAGGLLR